MNRPRLLGLLLLLALLLPRADLGAVSVYLREAAVIETESYTVGQVATIVGADAGRSAELAALPLGSTPRWPALLPAEAVRERLAAADPAASGEAVFVIGGRTALIPRRAVPPAQERFVLDLLAFLDQADPLKRGRIEVELITPSRLTGQTSWQFGFLPFPGTAAPTAVREGKPLAGEVLVWYEPGAAGGVSQTATEANAQAAGRPATVLQGGQRRESLRLWIHHFLPVAHARVSLAAGQPLAEEQLEYVEEDVSLSSVSLLIKGDPVEQYRTAAALPRGSRMETSRLERNLLVRTGEKVSVVFLRPGLRVSLPGVSLQSGAPGELILVRTQSGGKRFQGRVSAEGEVLVERF